VSFLLPEAFFLLLLVPLLLAAYLWMQRRRRRYVLRYASVSLARAAVGRGPGARRHVPPALFLLAVAAMIVAIAQPQITHAVSNATGTVVLAIDVSGSMQATDVAPTRLDAVKSAVREFVAAEPKGVKVGLVVFSDGASLVQAPTSDKTQLLDVLARLQPEAGTNIGGGLQTALNALGPRVDRAPTATPTSGAGASAGTIQPTGTVVLLSDGESNTGPSPLNVAQTAAAQGVTVDTVGIGTADGTVLHIRGQSIRTRLDEATLRGIAQATGGQYFGAQDAAQLRDVYHSLAQQQTTTTTTTNLAGLAIGGALLLSILGGALSLLWFNRLP
jgi:Ca-activated chloride channel family protein